MICACLGTALWLFCLKPGQVFLNPSCSLEYLFGLASRQCKKQEPHRGGWMSRGKISLSCADCERNVISESTISFLRITERYLITHGRVEPLLQSGSSCIWNPSVFCHFFSTPLRKICWILSYLSLILLLSWVKSGIHHSIQCVSQWFIRIQLLREIFTCYFSHHWRKALDTKFKMVYCPRTL